MKVCDDTIKVRCCSICSYLNEFDFPFEEKKEKTFTRGFESIFLNLLYIFHSQRKLSPVDNGKISSRTIHMLDYKQICTMECAYLNWAAEHNFGINNAYHVQLFEYVCAVEMQINDLWLKTFSIKRFLIWWKSWFIILNQKRDAFWKERYDLKRATKMLMKQEYYWYFETFDVHRRSNASYLCKSLRLLMHCTHCLHNIRHNFKVNKKQVQT